MVLSAEAWATGGSFWDGVKQGIISSALNHVAHMAEAGFEGGGDGGDPPNKGDGRLSQGSWGIEEIYDGTNWVAKENGRFWPASGQINSTESPIEMLIGGKAVFNGLKASYFSIMDATGGVKQWLRFGPSWSHTLQSKTSFSIRWGASPKYAIKIGNNYLRQINQKIRQIKLPGNNWRVKDPGHLHLRKGKN